MTIAINRDYQNDCGVYRRPLRCRYSQQQQLQDAYIELQESGTVIATYNSEIGNAVPMTVLHNRDRRWSINPELTVKQINKLLDEIEPLLERVHSGSDTHWDGSNHVGTLTDDAQAASAEIEKICESYYPAEWDWDLDGDPEED